MIEENLAQGVLRQLLTDHPNRKGHLFNLWNQHVIANKYLTNRRSYASWFHRGVPTDGCLLSARLMSQVEVELVTSLRLGLRPSPTLNLDST